MKRTGLVLLASLVVAAPAFGQRRIRLGPLLSSISVENGTGAAQGYGGYGGAVA